MSEETSLDKSPQPKSGGEFVIQKIYVKDISFESPQAPDIFGKEWKPEVNLQLNSTARAVAEHSHEVVLSITVTAKVERKTAFLVEVQQAGLFNIRGFNPQEQAHLLNSYCPNILFAFAREAVADFIQKGGFPQLLLAPINFDALYAQHLAQQTKIDAAQQEPMH